MTIPDTTAEEVDRIVARAAEASSAWARTAPTERARVMRALAGALDGAGPGLIDVAAEETHLTETRLTAELVRTTFQLRFLADEIVRGQWLDACIDHADPDWPMGAPRPDLRRVRIAVGPVVVFAAGNFPFAFSVAGGDTASALAAGSAVVLKVHPGHPRLSAETARVIDEVASAAGAPDALVQTVFGTEAGARVLRAPQIAAGAFTGSISGGRALFDIAAARPEPIPFFGELGSVNPAFVAPGAARARAGEIADGFVASVTGSAGQLCTKPGLLFVPADSELPAILTDAVLPDGVPMLNDAMRAGFARRLGALADHPDVVVANGVVDAASASPTPVLLRVGVDQVVADLETLTGEVFGPAALVVEYDDESVLPALAARLEGQLTASLFADPDDALAADLLPVLSGRAGRVLWNQWPTGVSVTHAQHHGGPYPATTAPATTSVGAAAITRFTRPVAYQNVPDALLPEPLRESNPWGVPRVVDGVLTTH
ncbi:aldehyde dehydrogenase family protein [Microbacterium trichothecenolyticum]|uniref:NADP-dependent aldehyde dehydrogenase n=1 Tax=Microbacterium trichothecenolyticum TaxID=69370 RepID=A0ABU0TU76_MICTR|nr:aldehyde dehydrogenase family protein [Microbacterium trichothecenolyticum]MDQ1122507.1 NADP-dependent aldehyde dehydrogenase [Microbacterium trichothecenolyticum]